jgi:hypothetical protein
VRLLPLKPSHRSSNEPQEKENPKFSWFFSKLLEVRVERAVAEETGINPALQCGEDAAVIVRRK